jgi:hypothetical protein
MGEVAQSLGEVMEASAFRTLRDTRAPVKVGSFAKCFSAARLFEKRVEWSAGAAIDTLFENEVCIVLKVEASQTGTYLLARVMYARGIGWMREDCLNALVR